MSDLYLGYGVRAEHDAALNQIWLRCHRDGAIHSIALTQEEIDALTAFTKDLPPLTGFAS